MVVTQQDVAYGCSPKIGGPERGRKVLGDFDKEKRLPRSRGRQVSMTKLICRSGGMTLGVRDRFGGFNNLEIIMATYVLLMLLTLAVSFLAVMVYRRISTLHVSTVHTGSLSEDSLVSLSQGSGQWSVGLHRG